MEFFHVTLQKNVESIFANGLAPSKDGLDGPGVYLWKGPLEDAVREADWSLSDNHSEMSSEEYEAFTKGLVMLSVTVPDDAVFSVEWPEYVVWDVRLVPREQVSLVGSFFDLLERIYPPAGVSEIVAEAEGRLEMQIDAAGSSQMRDFER